MPTEEERAERREMHEKIRRYHALLCSRRVGTRGDTGRYRFLSRTYISLAVADRLVIPI